MSTISSTITVISDFVHSIELLRCLSRFFLRAVFFFLRSWPYLSFLLEVTSTEGSPPEVPVDDQGLGNAHVLDIDSSKVFQEY